METILSIIMAALTPLLHFGERLMSVLPGMIGATILLLVGGLVAFFLRRVVDDVLRAIDLDDYVQKTGLANVLRRLGLGTSLTHLIGILVFGIIALSCVLGAAEVLGLPVLAEFLRRFVAFCPKLIGVALVMAGGLFVGDIVGGIVYRAAEANHVKGSEVLMRIMHGLMAFFSVIMSLEILEFPLNVVYDSLPGIVNHLGLGLAIAIGVAFGMAGKDLAGRVIRDLTPKSSRDVVPGMDHEPKMRVIK